MRLHVFLYEPYLARTGESWLAGAKCVHLDLECNPDNHRYPVDKTGSTLFSIEEHFTVV